mmetsp:Transcript_17292/g.43113  ORF Transcript_17292/g.43113 Transcript_17292/m.43113 type:complete len:85 (+) Transcript_17292:1752-2006(+)
MKLYEQRFDDLARRLLQAICQWLVDTVSVLLRCSGAVKLVVEAHYVILRFCLAGIMGRLCQIVRDIITCHHVSFTMYTKVGVLH